LDRPWPAAGLALPLKNDRMPQTPDHPGHAIRRWTFRLIGLFVIIGSLAIGLIGWLALANLADNIRKNPEVANDLSPLVLGCIDHRGWLPALVVPALVGGLWLLMGRARGAAWPVFILSMLWLFVLFATILYSFIMFMAPLYEYRPLD
jgi:hypothetical protein